MDTRTRTCPFLRNILREISTSKTIVIFSHSPMATALLLHCIPFSACNPNPSSVKPHSTRSSRITCSTVTPEVLSAKRRLLNLISDQERGLKTLKDPIKRSEIVEAIDAMGVLGRDTVTTGNSLSATWRLLWTTEKEQLFIIDKAPLFGTQAGDVLQVIDVEKRILNNVITFPPSGVFFVRSTIEIASSQRVNFRYGLFPFSYGYTYRLVTEKTIETEGR